MIFCRDEGGCQWHECGAYGSPCDGAGFECVCPEHANWKREPDEPFKPCEFKVYEGDEPYVAFHNLYESLGGYSRLSKMEHHAEPCGQCLYSLMSGWFYRGWFERQRGGNLR